MELLLTITLSDRLFTLLEDKLPNLGRRVEKAITKELSAQARRESNIAVELSASQIKPTETSTAVANPVEESAKDIASAPTVSDAIPENPQQIAEKIREIMHHTRQRFEGEDYKENTTSENYKKYHRQLTSWFKNIACMLGFEKPSYIDTPEGARSFREQCAELIIGEDGNITPPPAPF